MSFNCPIANRLGRRISLWQSEFGDTAEKFDIADDVHRFGIVSFVLPGHDRSSMLQLPDELPMVELAKLRPCSLNREYGCRILRIQVPLPSSSELTSKIIVPTVLSDYGTSETFNPGNRRAAA